MDQPDLADHPRRGASHVVHKEHDERFRAIVTTLVALIDPLVREVFHLIGAGALAFWTYEYRLAHARNGWQLELRDGRHARPVERADEVASNRLHAHRVSTVPS